MIRGVIHGDLRIEGDADVEMRGMVRGNVLLLGGTLRLPGMVTGNVLNRGGTLHITGLVKGDITTEGEGASTTHDPPTSAAAGRGA